MTLHSQHSHVVARRESIHDVLVKLTGQSYLLAELRVGLATDSNCEPE